jgi:histidyl-tRNA synthetase
MGGITLNADLVIFITGSCSNTASDTAVGAGGLYDRLVSHCERFLKHSVEER